MILHMASQSGAALSAACGKSLLLPIESLALAILLELGSIGNVLRSGWTDVISTLAGDMVGLPL